ncbi:MAG: hypothetical protein LBI13_07345 [Streptococcaceae bacterium]|nr:hypothetical protein [Streptococcaceae bacterium]
MKKLSFMYTLFGITLMVVDAYIFIFTKNRGMLMHIFGGMILLFVISKRWMRQSTKNGKTRIR